MKTYIKGIEDGRMVERQRCLAAVEAEQEFDGPMPPVLQDALGVLGITGAPAKVAELLRIAVALTKSGIRDRIKRGK